MNFNVSRVDKSNNVHPYTHKVQFYSDTQDTELSITQWLTEHEIKCCVVPYQSVSAWGKTVAVYLNESDTTAFLLKWA